MKKRWLVLLFLILLATPVIADHGEHERDALLHVDTGVFLIEIAAALLVISSFVMIPLKKHLTDNGKKIVFWSLVIPTVIASFYFAGAIVYENVLSQTDGPVHWHADYQVWACDERLDLVDPGFPSNKIGSPLFHEHDDDRIHIEGTVMILEDVDLGSYFEVIGSKLEAGHLIYRAKDKTYDLRDGEECNGQPATLKVFVNGERVEDYEDRLIYPDAYVPPGDCIIIEFSPGTAETTDKICSSWEAKGWNYENYDEKREDRSVGGVTWQ